MVDKQKIGIDAVKDAAKTYFLSSRQLEEAALTHRSYAKLKCIFERCCEAAGEEHYVGDLRSFPLYGIIEYIIKTRCNFAFKLLEETDLEKLGEYYNKFIYCMGYSIGAGKKNVQYEVIG